MLTKKRFTLELCKYLCLDEADRLIGDQNFEEEVRTPFYSPLVARYACPLHHASIDVTRHTLLTLLPWVSMPSAPYFP